MNEDKELHIDWSEAVGGGCVKGNYVANGSGLNFISPNSVTTTHGLKGILVFYINGSVDYIKSQEEKIEKLIEIVKPAWESIVIQIEKGDSRIEQIRL